MLAHPATCLSHSDSRVSASSGARAGAEMSERGRETRARATLLSIWSASARAGANCFVAVTTKDQGWKCKSEWHWARSGVGGAETRTRGVPLAATWAPHPPSTPAREDLRATRPFCSALFSMRTGGQRADELLASLQKFPHGRFISRVMVHD